jgi:HK97 gp10 family phage protein
MTNQVQILGMNELQRILKELPYQVRSKLVIQALMKSAEPMKQEAVNLAPKKTGKLKKAIVIVKNGFEDTPGVMIAPTKGKRVENDAWYARFQEFGTSGFGKRKRSLSSVSANLKTGKLLRKYKTTGYKMNGSGLPSVRFMQRAFDGSKEIVLNSVHTELSKIVTKYLQKNAPHYYVN